MSLVGDLKVHVIQTIALALAAGIVYFVSLYALEHSPDTHAGFWIVIGGALIFRLMLAPLSPSLSTDLYRYRWEGKVQNAGWNPYAVAPTDPRLARFRDYGWSVMPVPELAAQYPPLSELIFARAERLAERFPEAPGRWKISASAVF